jgi:hypothetical protein
MRHVRLMNRLRRFYFFRLAWLTVAILMLVISAVIWGIMTETQAPLHSGKS